MVGMAVRRQLGERERGGGGITAVEGRERRKRRKGRRRKWWRIRKSVPLTVKVADRLTEPARFDAEQAYSPACLADTPSMLSVLRCLLILVTVILESLDVSIATPLNAHDISMGMSPFKIEQGTDTESPEFATSALNAIGRSCGPTEVIVRLDERERVRISPIAIIRLEREASFVSTTREREGRGGERLFHYGAVFYQNCAENER